MTDPLITEAVILVRQGNRTMAVHVPNIWLLLTPIVDEPIITEQIGFYRGPSITGYEIEATGTADRLTIWEGTDPFDREALTEAQEAIDA